MSNLRETFVDELRDLYDAEKQLLKALPRIAKAAENEELRAAFEQHIEETEGQIERLEEVFSFFEEPVRAKRCKGMAGLIEEAAELIKENAGDAALICAAQKAEHYEIAAYGSLAAWAKLLEEEQALALLEDNLNEERQTDETLTEIAERIVNVEEEEPAPRRGSSRNKSRAKTK